MLVRRPALRRLPCVRGHICWLAHGIPPLPPSPRSRLLPHPRYDNEYGYSARYVDVARMVARSL